MFSFIKFLIIVGFCLHVYYSTVATTLAPENEDLVEETQHAICKIITDDVKTSANATIKRQLKGVCTTKLIERKFRELEIRLFSELNQIKSLLNGRDSNVKTITDYDYVNYENIAAKSFDEIESETNENIEKVTEIIFQESSYTRTEIGRLNNTVYTFKGERVYSYYWQIPDIETLLKKSGTYSKSGDFFVLGHQMYLQLFPNHLGFEYLGLKLKVTSNFTKKYKFLILDQLDNSKDLTSQSFRGGSTVDVYRVPYAKLLERHYLENNSLIVQIIIYLNS